MRVFTSLNLPIPENLQPPKSDDYNILWSYLKGLPALKGKQFPGRTKETVWAIAMGKEESVPSSGVCMKATLVIQDRKLRIEFEPLTLNLQSRLSRKFGADRFLTIGIPSPEEMSRALKHVLKTTTEEEICTMIVKWISNSQHSFLNRTWKWFSVSPRKEPSTKAEHHEFTGEETRKIYLHDHCFFATKSPDFNAPEESCKNMEIGEMLRWLIPLEENKKQQYTKLFSRITLGSLLGRLVFIVEFTNRRRKIENVGDCHA